MFHSPEFNILKSHIISQAHAKFFTQYGSMNHCHDLILRKGTAPFGRYKAHLIVYLWWPPSPGCEAAHSWHTIRTTDEFTLNDAMDHLNAMHRELMK
jgi:hypothetical protein